MDNLQEEQKGMFYDLLINYFMNNPSLYDKLEEKYVVTLEKVDKLKILSEYLKELQIEKSIPEIIAAWKDLVKKFKKYLADSNNIGSGSGAKEDDFPYAEHLMFLKPALQHRQALSTMTSQHSEFSVATISCQNNFIHTPSSSNGIATDTTSFSIPPQYLPCIENSSLTTNKNKVSARSWSSSSSITSSKQMNVPELDHFAKKKLKLMANSEETVKDIGKKIVEMMDQVNSKLMAKQTVKESTITESSMELPSQSVDYKRHLTAAVSNIPLGYENQFMEFVIQQIDNFDRQQMEN